MESTIGTIIGVLGFALAVFIAVRQVQAEKRNAQERAEEKERNAQERAEEKERHAQERAEEKEMHAKQLEMQKQELEWQRQEMERQKKETERTNRLIFLADRIFDPTIPRELRLPFYEEYLSMGGNGTAVKFWLIEGEREKKQNSK